MTTTDLKTIRRRMIREEPELLGRVETVASLTTLTVVVTELAFGGLSEQLFVPDWIIRADTATAADRVRSCTAFAPGTGTLTHAGTNYGDTTAGSEIVEILNNSTEPRVVEQSIYDTLRDLMRLDITTIPGLSNKGRQWLQDLDWIENPNDIFMIKRVGSQRISRNAYLNKFNSYSSGALQPDYWVQAGSGASMARSTTLYDTDGLREGRKVQLSMTRSGTDTTLTQNVGLLFGGVDSTSLQGETVTVWGRAKSGTASSLRMFCNDGVTTTYSSYHSGGGGIEELEMQKTLDDDATILTFGFSLEEDETVELARGELLFATGLQDGDRIDQRESEKIWHRGSDQSGGDLPVDLPTLGRGACYEIHSQRAYPPFTQSRIDGGTADADLTEAPEDIVFRGALAKLFEKMSGSLTEDTTRYQQEALRYGEMYNTLKRDHLNLPAEDEIPWRRRRAFASPARR